MSPILSLPLSFSSVARRTLMLVAAVILFFAPDVTDLPQIKLLSAAAQAREPFGEQHARPRIKLTLGVGAHSINAEIAANEADRERGLMFRNALGRNDGMLFLFDETARHCFWMRNTKIPLSIAFIDNDGIITDIDEMQPETLDNHCPTRAGRYALEMNPHWFSSRGIRAGMRISGLPLR